MTDVVKTIYPEPEKKELTLGFIPLLDCCVLVAAKEKGFFEKYGLDVTLQKEASWANIRDKVSVGALDGAHMLAAMPIATTLGLGFTKKPMLTAFSMNLNGNAITVSNKLYERLLKLDPSIETQPEKTPSVLKQLIDQDKQANKPPLCFAMVYPYSSHNYELRYWMATGDIDPDNDINLRAIPPQYMVENLKEGQIDGFCVGEPWNSRASQLGMGKILIAGYQIWNNSPEKVFAVTRAWAEKFPNTHLCLIMALLEAAQWIDIDDNRQVFADVLATEHYISLDADIIKSSFAGNIHHANGKDKSSLADFHVYHRYLANFPWCSHACWYMTQMIRWGQLKTEIDMKQMAESVYRPDIYRRAADLLGLGYPSFNYKMEGINNSDWTLQNAGNQFNLGADAYFDGRIFDPDNLIGYIEETDISRLAINLNQAKKLN